MKRLAGSPVFLVAVLICLNAAAWGLPLLVSDGTAGLTGGDEMAARVGLQAARGCFWDNDLERVWVRRFRVAGVTGAEGMTRDDWRPAPGCQVRVCAYTFFALPYGSVIAYHTGASVEYRLPTGPLSFLVILVAPIFVAIRCTGRGR